jgi:hypothetical protein
LLLLFAVVAAGCGPNLRHVGYTSSNKVWYHWQKGSNDHIIVVCDVLPDGTEINCKDTRI